MTLSVSPIAWGLPGGLGGGESRQAVLKAAEDFPGDGLAAIAPVGGGDLFASLLA